MCTEIPLCAKNSVTLMHRVWCKPYYAGCTSKFLAHHATTLDIFAITCFYSLANMPFSGLGNFSRGGRHQVSPNSRACSHLKCSGVTFSDALQKASSACAEAATATDVIQCDVSVRIPGSDMTDFCDAGRFVGQCGAVIVVSGDVTLVN